MQKDYFSHFGLAAQFNLDLKMLGAAYRQRQQASHPDRHVHADSTTRLKAVTDTAFNTEAYQILKSSVQRGVYLLQFKGVDFSLENYTFSDMELLMQQLNFREQLAEIKENNDEEELLSLSHQVKLNIARINTDLITLFDEFAELNVTEIQAKLCELQFFDKLQIECDEVEEQIELD